MPEMSLSEDGGIYIALFHLPKPRHLTVGALGRYRFEAGIYAYVGSAQKNLTARLNRHARRRKPLRWHIDCLSTKATMMRALILPAKKYVECQVARGLAKHFQQPIRGFGSSDCRCDSHLFFLPTP